MATIEQIQDGPTIATVIDSTGGVTTVVSGADGSGNIGVTTLNELSDVDVITEGTQDGSVLVYKAQTSKWTSTRLLNQQFMEGGEF
jgi:hypothetical protein